MTVHKPVLTKEVLEYLNPKSGDNFIDGTVGQAGHALLMLEKTKPDGRVLGIDSDANQIENSKLQTENVKERITLVNDSYANIKSIVEKIKFAPVKGILLDLGYSSWQLEDANRGFTFQKDQVLDMRYNLSRSQSDRGSSTESGQNTITAEKVINEYSERELEHIISEYGEERFAKQIAKKIIEERETKRIKTTFELKNIIMSAVLRKFQDGRIHVATRTFQAIRIAVNDELNNLKKFLPAAVSVLPAGGRLAIISFHSLEDRIVKNFFKDKEKEEVVKILTKKPVVALDDEIILNPRARSAKMRVVVKL